jgi:hypothetical protein
MNNIPKQHLFKEAQENAVNMRELPLIRTLVSLCVSWNTTEDSFYFNIQVKENPTTR